MRFGMGMEGAGYNIYALGPSGIGKLTVVSQMLERQAAARPAPLDWVYVQNFAEHHKPDALSFPAGQGVRFRQEMEGLIEDLRVAIPAAFEDPDEALQSILENLDCPVVLVP